MTNRWLGGMVAASVLLMVACQGESNDAAQLEDDALAGDFDTAENRVLPDGGVAAAGGRGGCAGGQRGSVGRTGHHDGGVAHANRADHANGPDRAGHADRDQDQDEDGDEGAGHRDPKKGGDHDGGVRARRGDDRCGSGRPAGGHDRDGGPAHARDAGSAGGGGRDPRRDAGAQAGGGARTVTLPDGTSVRLDPGCPDFSGGGFDLPGCCLPANTCGLSTHLIDVTGVPKGCQGYATARQIDPSFPLADKACTFQK